MTQDDREVPVRVAEPGDGSGIERAADRLRALDYVTLATPYFGE
jgi:hypothetical protein